jgi:hypothetical protein
MVIRGRHRTTIAKQIIPLYAPMSYSFKIPWIYHKQQLSIEGNQIWKRTTSNARGCLKEESQPSFRLNRPLSTHLFNHERGGNRFLRNVDPCGLNSVSYNSYTTSTVWAHFMECAWRTNKNIRISGKETSTWKYCLPRCEVVQSGKYFPMFLPD